jgi:DNA-nicking Smr family endonuclease
MMKRSRESDDLADDAELFQREVGDIKPLRHNQAPVKKARTVGSPQPAHGESDSSVESGEVLRFLRPGIQATVLQQLRRGRFPIQATLDLHGLTAAEANSQLHRFVLHSQGLGRAAVRIVHGKGHGSKGQQPILKAKINQWLREFTAVLAFCSSRPQDGGTGAVDVLLRKSTY